MLTRKEYLSESWLSYFTTQKSNELGKLCTVDFSNSRLRTWLQFRVTKSKLFKAYIYSSMQFNWILIELTLFALLLCKTGIIRAKSQLFPNLTRNIYQAPWWFAAINVRWEIMVWASFSSNVIKISNHLTAGKSGVWHKIDMNKFSKHCHSFIIPENVGNLYFVYWIYEFVKAKYCNYALVCLLSNIYLW